MLLPVLLQSYLNLPQQRPEVLLEVLLEVFLAVFLQSYLNLPQQRPERPHANTGSDHRRSWGRGAGIPGYCRVSRW